MAPRSGRSRRRGEGKLLDKPRRVLVLFSLLLLLAGLASPAVGASVGTFIQVEGAVEVLHQGRPPAVPVKIRDGVAKGDQVRTKSQSRAQLRFVDDTLLTLSPGSSILIEEYLYDAPGGYRQAALHLFRGLAYTVVNRILQTEKPDFVVKSHTAVLGVRGTRFFTLAAVKFTGNYLEQGLAEVVALAAPTAPVLLKSMESAVAPIGRGLTKQPLSPADLSLLRQWLVSGVPQRVLTGDPPFMSFLGPPDQKMPSLDLPRDREGGMFVPPAVVPEPHRMPAPVTPQPQPQPHYHPY